MKGGGGGGGQVQSDQTASFFWLICLAVGVVLVAWWLKREWIVVPIFWFRIAEIQVLMIVFEGWAKIVAWLPWLHLPAPDLKELANLKDYMLTTPVHYVKFAYFSAINHKIGDWLRYPSMAVLAIMAFFIYFRHTSSRFQRKFTMQEFKKQEVQNWPEITPVISVDLLKEDIEEGPWAMPKLPLHFCKEHDMLYIGESEEGKLIYKLKPEPAYRVFALQVGNPWRGVQPLPIHLKALVVIFIARALRQRDIADRFLKQIASSAGSGKLDFSGVEEQLKKYEDAKPIKWLEARHAYVGTLIPTLLEMARIDGVLASAEFLWLKPVDRRMWFMLNNVGRHTAVVEIAGLFGHWLAEKKLGRPLKNPMVKEAVNALDEEVQKILYIPETDKWQ